MRIKNLIKRLIGIKSPEESCKEYLLKNGMKVGKNTSIYSWTTIDAGKPWLIEIGEGTIISTGVQILTHDASPNIVNCGTKLGRVSIGNNVFVGTRSVVLCNTRIGDNVIVGAGSVVTRDLPQEGVYAGSPAKYICSIEDYRKRCEKLRSERPSFDKIRPWNTWKEATEEEKRFMYDELEDGVGFF